MPLQIWLDQHNGVEARTRTTSSYRSFAKQSPTPSNAQVVRRALARPPEFYLVGHAEHFSFMPSCGPMSPLLPPMLCKDPIGFDRAAFHQAFNGDVVRFFDAHIRRR